MFTFQMKTTWFCNAPAKASLVPVHGCASAIVAKYIKKKFEVRPGNYIIKINLFIKQTLVSTEKNEEEKRIHPKTGIQHLPTLVIFPQHMHPSHTFPDRNRHNFVRNINIKYIKSQLNFQNIYPAYLKHHHFLFFFNYI